MNLLINLHEPSKSTSGHLCHHCCLVRLGKRLFNSFRAFQSDQCLESRQGPLKYPTIRIGRFKNNLNFHGFALHRLALPSELVGAEGVTLTDYCLQLSAGLIAHQTPLPGFVCSASQLSRHQTKTFTRSITKFHSQDSLSIRVIIASRASKIPYNSNYRAYITPFSSQPHSDQAVQQLQLKQ